MADPWVRVDRPTAGTCAEIAAGTGAAAVVTLGLMYAIEVPKGGPYIFGTTNDALGAVTNVLMMPVIAELTGELPPGRWRDGLAAAALAASAAGAASGALLVLRVLPFAPSTAISLAAMEVQGVWMLVTHRRLLSDPTFPRGLGALGRSIGVGLLSGSVLAGLGMLAPAQSPVRKVALAVGAAAGAASWIAWPVWLHLAGRHLRDAPRTKGRLSP